MRTLKHTSDRKKIEQYIFTEAGYLALKRKGVQIGIALPSFVIFLISWSVTKTLNFSVFVWICSFVVFAQIAYSYTGSIKKYRGEAILSLQMKFMRMINSHKRELLKKEDYLLENPEIEQEKERIIFEEKNPNREIFADIEELKTNIANMEKTLEILISMKPKVSPS